VEDEHRHYEAWIDKGLEVRGFRFTLIPNRTELLAGDVLRLMHVAEATTDAGLLYPMGPKPVIGEFVDGKRQGPESRMGDFGEPLDYDGLVVAGPAIDSNFEESTYSLEPGRHEIVWRPQDGLESNTLRILVRPRDGQ
jgi:hypothetical protein